MERLLSRFNIPQIIEDQQSQEVHVFVSVTELGNNFIGQNDIELSYPLKIQFIQLFGLLLSIEFVQGGDDHSSDFQVTEEMAYLLLEILFLLLLLAIHSFLIFS
jgi:hypothetical protein